MKSLFPSTLLAILIGIPSMGVNAAFAKDEMPNAKQKIYDDTKRELTSLENIKTEKLEGLEKKEAERWDARYRQAAHAKENDEKSRSLEEKYGRLAAELSKLEDELVKSRNETKDKEDEAEAARGLWDGFNASLKRNVDGAAENLSLDIPLAIEERTLILSRASELMESNTSKAKTPDTKGALDQLMNAQLMRIDLTESQSVVSHQAIFADGRPAEAWRVQLGTIFIGELEKSGNGESQILLRTGNLQGRTFVWRSDLAESFNRTLASSIADASQSKSQINLPLDVLQYKSVGSGYIRGEKQSAWAKFKEWFKAGGVTLYPLFAVGIISLLMILERLIYFARKNTNAEKFMRQYMEFANARRWNEASNFCKRSGSALAKTLGAIADHADQSRDTVEKAVREVLLREVPALEKRLPLIAAMGAAAPLLGLLGTVSGLVTLFQVLNQLGANDPKVLAGGISEALINTETGLGIAIPVLLVHGYLNEKLDSMNATLSSCSLEVLNKIWPKG